MKRSPASFIPTLFLRRASQVHVSLSKLRANRPPGNSTYGCVGTVQVSASQPPSRQPHLRMCGDCARVRSPHLHKVCSSTQAGPVRLCHQEPLSEQTGKGCADATLIRVLFLLQDTPVWLSSSPPPGGFPQLTPLSVLQGPSPASPTQEPCRERQCFSNCTVHAPFVSADPVKMQTGLRQVGGVGFCISHTLSG